MPKENSQENILDNPTRVLQCVGSAAIAVGVGYLVYQRRNSRKHNTNENVQDNLITKKFESNPIDTTSTVNDENNETKEQSVDTEQLTSLDSSDTLISNSVSAAVTLDPTQTAAIASTSVISHCSSASNTSDTTAATESSPETDMANVTHTPETCSSEITPDIEHNQPNIPKTEQTEQIQKSIQTSPKTTSSVVPDTTETVETVKSPNSVNVEVDGIESIEKNESDLVNEIFEMLDLEFESKCVHYTKIQEQVNTLKLFKYKNGSLKVTVITAQNIIKPHKARSESSSYIKVTILHDFKLHGSHSRIPGVYEHKDRNDTKKTKCVTHNINSQPIWNEEFEFSVNDALNDCIKIELFNKNTFKNDSLKAFVIVPIIAVCRYNGVYENQWVEMQRVSRKHRNSQPEQISSPQMQISCVYSED